MAASVRVRALLSVACGVAAAFAVVSRLGATASILDVRCEPGAGGWDVTLSAWGDVPVEDVRVAVVGGAATVEGAGRIEAIAPGTHAAVRVVATPVAAGPVAAVTLRVSAERPTSRTWDTVLPGVPR